jgi:pilus assembly protein CpaD
MQSALRTKLIAAFSLALALIGCAGDPDRAPEAQAVADVVNVVFHHGKWRQIPSTPENQAEVIVFEQRVSFASETALLDRSARQAIDRLLAESDAQPGTLIRLSVPGGQQGATTFDRLTLQRLESVRSDLASRGYDSALADSAVARVGPLGDHEVGLTVSRWMAVLPDCDQPQPLEPARPSFDSGYGCANAYNLGVMVDDPADLARGRPLDPAEAERANLVIQRYRVDDPLLDTLLEEKTSKQ